MKLNREDELRIAEEAAAWLYRLNDEGGAECQAAFTAWLKQSPRHMQELLMMTAVTRELDAIDQMRQIDVKQLVSEAAANLVSLQNDSRSAVPGPPKRAVAREFPQRRQWIIRTAAAIALLVIGALLTIWQSLQSPTYITAIGEQRTVKLDDGSMLYLNTHSRVQVRYSATARDVRLERGEALFVVAREPKRPFIVAAGELAVRAVGTQFNVLMREDDTTVSVVEGRVQITAPSSGASALTSAGEEAKVARGGKIVKRLTAATTEPIAWRQRRLVFRNDTLANIVDEFNRYNRIPQFRIDTPAVGERLYTGTFDADDPQSLRELLYKESDLILEQRGSEIYIQGRSE